MKLLPFPLLLAFAAALAPCSAETVKDREAAVRNDRATVESDPRWIYNDWRRGFEEAKRTGKPLLVVLRCVPCLACAGIDAQVLLQEAELAPLLDRFVCVRVINANALDLSLFQFDYDLSFSTLFFNGDGTVYGRYGSWLHQKDAQEKTTAGFRRAVEKALALHAGYPQNKPSLAGKQGRPVEFQTPIDLPTLAGRYRDELDWNGKVVQSCVHCHQIGDAMREQYRAQDGRIPARWIYPWPAPETIGLTLAPDQPARVQSVATGSAGAGAGFRAGDEIVSFAGQALLSVADVSWALHHAGDSDTLPAVVRRGAAEMPLQLVLPASWREKANISRRVGTWPMRGMATGGLLLEELNDEERRRLALGPDRMALLLKHVGEYGKHAAAKKAGFQKGDVLVEVDGKSARTSESELLGYLLQSHRPGQPAKAVVLRGGARVELMLPAQ
jgi:serine protease Do